MISDYAKVLGTENCQFDNVCARSPGNSYSYSWRTDSILDDGNFQQHNKRPQLDLESCTVDCKRRHLDVNLEDPLYTNTFYQDHVPAYEDRSFLEEMYRFSDEKTNLRPIVWSHAFSSYFDEFSRADYMDHAEEIQLPSLEPVRQKHFVAVGPNYQADLPDCEPCGSSNRVDHNSNKWISYCIMPMPDLVSDTFTAKYKATEYCCCVDEGSIRCVRRHINESREDLINELGQEKFVELGLHDIGEYAESKWTEEDGQLFRDVVFSNPASLRRNFWYDLPRALPGKTRKELVSYYFNIFVLRKRAKQNRLDPMNIDSDNDEWQEQDVVRLVEQGENEDSAADSPSERDHRMCDGKECNENVHEDSCDDDETQSAYVGEPKFVHESDTDIPGDSCT